MGMFDSFIIDIEILPLTEKEKEKYRGRLTLQTKSLDCSMTTVVVTADKKLTINRAPLVEVPISERICSRNPNIPEWVGSLERGDDYVFLKDFNGDVIFYDLIDDNWIEFGASFENGLLTKITRID